jgi:hypothetical protein
MHAYNAVTHLTLREQLLAQNYPGSTGVQINPTPATLKDKIKEEFTRY